MIVADTDVLIDFLQGRNPAADRVRVELEDGHLAVTAVGRFELLAGARSTRVEQVIHQLLDAIRCLPLDAPSADRAAAVRRQLEEQGSGIGMADSLVAGVVLTAGSILLTRNLRHFERIPGLKLATL